MSFDYHEPMSVQEAVEPRHPVRPEMAGSSPAGPTFSFRCAAARSRPRHVLSLHRVPGLDAIEADGVITLGALVHPSRVSRRPPAFRGPLQALIEGAEVSGGHQMRNVATVGGNIVERIAGRGPGPGAARARCRGHLLGPGGERRLPLEEFASGPARRRGAPTSC